MSQSPDTFSPRERARIEATTREVGRFIFERCHFDRPNVFDRRWWDDRMMAWAMSDEALKVQMFRFVDVLPMLNTSEAVTQHLQEYFYDVRGPLPGAVRLGLAVASPRSLAGRALAIAAHRNVQNHARRFVAGSNTHRSAGRRHAQTKAASHFHARHSRRSGHQRDRSGPLP